ncbi:response regulator [Arcticibacterium luteifluviistationis]|uniref:Response regulator n=1 Tax=Arcticibacterium luteifluviistationis TaxID=1784714 RepID=A0A2Z4G9T6_9BACT|nr:response regulator [Arcticibacterium luteifluviistationis]AWV97999.1 response regulator [Arcticibacterium luteifluviistationis]
MDVMLESILLVDDDHITNFIHQKIIDNLKCAKHVKVAKNGLEAIDYLKQDSTVLPDLIFLDINMPKMNGWEFLEAYGNLDNEGKENTVIIILTTSQNPDDFEKAKASPYVKVIENKPLTKDMISNIVTYYFPD